MREIGSEFWDIPTTEQSNNIFSEHTQWYLSGRSALQAIIQELKNCQSVAMPSWCCDSMIKPFVDAGYSIHFYPVVFDGGLVQEIKADSDVLFLMDYFGYSTPVFTLPNYHGIVIRDVTHSIFSTSYSDTDYCFGSLRKWCGFWSGGYAWERDGHRLLFSSADDKGYIDLRKQAMEQKEEYITGKRADKSYLKLFNQAEEILEDIGALQAAERDIHFSKKLDIEFVSARRRANAEVLRKAFPSWLIFPTLNDQDTPMFVPVLVPDNKRNSLKKHLIEHSIYCPVHWPISQYHRLTQQEKYIYDNELSLVCDQRYTEQDMQRMVETIEQFMEA